MSVHQFPAYMRDRVLIILHSSLRYPVRTNTKAPLAYWAPRKPTESLTYLGLGCEPHLPNL